MQMRRPGARAPVKTSSTSRTLLISDANVNTLPADTQIIPISYNTLIDAGIFGTLSVAAMNGVATFNDIHVTGSGMQPKLKAVASGLTNGVSNIFTITAPPAP